LCASSTLATDNVVWTPATAWTTTRAAPDWLPTIRRRGRRDGTRDCGGPGTSAALTRRDGMTRSRAAPPRRTTRRHDIGVRFALGRSCRLSNALESIPAWTARAAGPRAAADPPGRHRRGRNSMTGDPESESAYVIKVGAWIRSIRRQQHLSLHDVEAASDDEFKASSWEPTNAASGQSRCPGCSGSPASTEFPSTRCCPRRRARPPFGQWERPGGRSDGPRTQPSRNPGPARHRTDRGARGRDAQTVPTPHPMAARRLQRPHAHYPPRRPANGRLHLRLPSGAGACSARQPSAPPGPIGFPSSGPRPCSRGHPSRAGRATTPTLDKKPAHGTHADGNRHHAR
jgi:hypothetical protein